MSKENTILAIIEPDIQPLEVAERAGWLARLYDCKLTMLLCDPDVGPLHRGWYLSEEAKQIGAQIEAAQSEYIEELADNIRATGIDVSTGVLEDRPVGDAIIHEVRERNPRMLIKGTQYHSASERAIFVDTDWQLVRSCPCTVYFARSEGLDEHPVIVAAVDPTHTHDKPAALDQVIVTEAKSLGERTGGELHLLHTYERLTGVGHEAARTFKPIKIPLDEIDQRIKAEHREKLDALAAANDIDADHVHQLPGRPRELLPMFARTHGAGVVVMGALARWGLKRAVIGSTTERVMDHLPCDVLIVRMEPTED